MSLYSRRWFCALSGSVRGRVSEFRDAHKARYDCLSLCADLNKKNCVRCNRQARRDWARRACSFNVWQPSGWIIRDVLAGTDYEITEAEDGEHALAAVAKQRPDLILMEIQLPSMDGYDQSTKFLFAINHQTARALGIDVRPDVLSIADEVIE